MNLYNLVPGDKIQYRQISDSVTDIIVPVKCQSHFPYST